MKNLHFVSIIIAISFFSCNNANKNETNSFSDLNTDFPTSEELEFKPVNEYDILERGECLIEDSILWYFGGDEHSIGSCYNLNTGEKLSMIASRGKAAYEIINLEGCKIIGDSIHLYTRPNTIKTFAKKEILENRPMGERTFSVTTIPDSILARRMVKLPNGSVLATIQPNPGPGIKEENRKREINKKSVVLWKDNEVNSYETITYNRSDVGGEASEVEIDELIKCAYSDGLVEIKGNDMAVFSVRNQFIVYTFDINNKNVVNEKRYTKILSEGGSSLSTRNDMDMQIGILKPNDQSILCMVDGYFSEEDKKSNSQKIALFVFDWNLNPIKRFDLPRKKNSKYIVSNDCRSLYIAEFTDNGLAISKADLSI